MDKDLANGQIGAVGNYDVAFTGGKVVVSINVGLPELNVKVSAEISPKTILDQIAAKVGGPIPVEVAKFMEDALALS